MIKKIMVNEWRLLSREWATYISIPIYVLLLAYGIASGTTWKNFVIENTLEARALADEGIQKKVAKLDRILAGEPYSYREDPRLAAPYARWLGYEFAIKPPMPTAAISVGQSDLAPSYLKVQWKPMHKQRNVDEVENPQNLAVGAFDLAFVLVYLFPLLIIALSYNILSAEREDGTQVLLLSQPLSVGKFVMGKIALRGVLIIGLAVGISLVGLLVANPDIFEANSLWRIGILAAILILYGAFWFGLAVAVNALEMKSATNALVMMACWLVLVPITPAVSNISAKSLYPLPSRIELVEAVRRADEQAAKESGFERAFYADLLRKSEEAALEASTVDFYLKTLPLELHAEEIAGPVFDKFNNQKRQQRELAGNLKYLSPAAVTQIALGELANHSALNFEHYKAQVEDYHKIWREYFMKPVMEHRNLTRDEMVNVPRFTYVPEEQSVVLSRLLKDALALILFAAVTFAFGFNRLKNYSPAKR